MAVQKLLDHLKKTTFWEFRVKYLAELGPAIDNAIRVEVLSVDPEVVAEAVRFVTVRAPLAGEEVLRARK
jgi:hypothetical protein